MYKTILPHEVPTMQLQALVQGVVAPRPIALASTVDAAGQVNLSPFSFFNVFSSNPPVLIFSPARRVRDNTTKHTLENVLEVPEVVINIVNYNMVEQVSLASTEYARGVDEFVKSGLTPVAASLVRPPLVAESPAAFECRVKDVIALGDQGGAGNLIICEIVACHFQEYLFDAQGKIDPYRADLVARMGGDWYCRANGDALFEVEKPLVKKGIGVDVIPAHIRNSEVLSGNDLGRLGNVEVLPTADEIAAIATEPSVAKILGLGLDTAMQTIRLQQLAHEWLGEGRVMDAWKVLLL